MTPDLMAIFIAVPLILAASIARAIIERNRARD
jgi:hypothetical protein